jgi:hypothetical protein
MIKAENLRKRYLTYSVPKLKQIADDIFSVYIRTVYSKKGLVQCFTCDRVFPIKEMDNGHYVSRICGYLRYSEKNCHPQCIYCNRFKEGNKDEYTLRIIKKYGVEMLEELNRWKHKTPVTWDRRDLVDIIENYKEKVKSLP